jgi:hypothetical protein
MEPNQVPTRKPVDYEELGRIDDNFRKNYRQIMDEVAAVINKHLDPDNTGRNYRVSAVTFAPPNPDLCLPYVRYDRVNGVVVGVSCF